MIDLVWCCTCGSEHVVSEEIFYSYGSPYLCSSCGETFVSVRNARGHRVWLHIEKREVEFHDLNERPNDDEVDGET